MYPTHLLLAAMAFCSLASSLQAEHFSYGDKVPAGVHKEQFNGRHCRISVYGPSGGSFVKGHYDDPNGVLKISVDRLSYLEVKGRAKKVVITFVDLNSNVNLTNLAVGGGGIEVHSVNRRSKVDIGACEGPVMIKSVDSSSISLPSGIKVIGRDRLTGGSEINIESPSIDTRADR